MRTSIGLHAFYALPTLLLSTTFSATAFAQTSPHSNDDHGNLLPTGALSTSGNDLVSPTTQLQTSAADPLLESRIKQLETEIASLKKTAPENHDAWDWTHYVTIKGYIQPQLIYQFFNAASSPNSANGVLPPGIGSNDTIAKANGTTTNPDFFRLRRARIMAVATPTDFARVIVEIEPLPKGGSIPGSGTVGRWIEATAIARITEGTRLEFGMGEFKVPFGFEVLQPDADRPFIERSWVEQNLFPAEFDIGAHASLYALKNKLEVRTSILNGVTMGETNFAVLPDFNRGKDGTLRINYNFGPADIGLNGYIGSGQVIDAAKLRFKQYPRWAGNFELALHHEFSKKLGQTKAFAEVTYANNLDRGVNYSFALPTIPTNINADVVDKHELGFFVRAEQDASRWLTFGVRYDYYTPDTSIADNQRHTVSGVAVFHITKGLQFMAEYDSALDRVHAANTVAQTKTVDTFSGVLQGRF